MSAVCPSTFRFAQAEVDALSVRERETKYNKNNAKTLLLARRTSAGVHVPLHHFVRTFRRRPNEDVPHPRAATLAFAGQLNKAQAEAKDEAMDKLRRTCSVFVEFSCGMGKTVFALYLACRLGYKFAVVVHSTTLRRQWRESMRKWIPGVRVQDVAAKGAVDPAADAYILNIDVVAKRDHRDYLGVGTLVVDEAHLQCTEKRAHALLHFRPRYCIGLSATPDDRVDGLDKVLDFFFNKKHIVRTRRIPFTVVVERTGYTYESRYQTSGGLDWNHMLAQQSENDARNARIAEYATLMKDRNILVLCKRVAQARRVLELLRAAGEDCDIYTGSKDKFDYESRVLLSTYSKSGVGFDHPKLDTLIVAADVDNGIRQYFGRIFRRDDVRSVVVELVDDHPSFVRHYRSRLRHYKESGGTVVRADQYLASLSRGRGGPGSDASTKKKKAKQKVSSSSSSIEKYMVTGPKADEIEEAGGADEEPLFLAVLADH